MSIVYPEANASVDSKADIRNTPVSAGSALFPGGAANLYRRNTASTRGPSAKLAWIAAPVAVVLIGGGVLMALPHAKTAPAATSTATRTTVAPAAAQAMVKTPAAKPVLQAATSQAVTSSDGAPTRRSVAATGMKRSRSTPRPVPEARTTVAPTLPTAPQPYGTTQGKADPDAPVVSTLPSQPTSQLGPQPTAPATPTPGDFQFTAPPTGPAAASPAGSTSTAATPQPVGSSPQAPPQPQG